MTPRMYRPAALLFGTDPRLSFNADGTRTLACADIRPRPMTLLECEKRAALQRKADGMPEPGPDGTLPAYSRMSDRMRVISSGRKPRYPKRQEVALRDASNMRGGRFPLGRTVQDDRLRSGVR